MLYDLTQVNIVHSHHCIFKAYFNNNYKSDSAVTIVTIYLSIHVNSHVNHQSYLYVTGVHSKKKFKVQCTVRCLYGGCWVVVRLNKQHRGYL